MKSPFKNIGIVTRPNTPEIQDTVHTLVSFLRENGFTIYLDELSVEEHCVYIQDSAYCETVNKAQLGKYCDLVVVLGGDGTFLSAAREVAPRAVPIIGINQGHLGFLTQISRDTMVEGIRPVLEGKYLPEERILIEASIIRDGETIERAGLIISTPTGSTAYALAAGGPIMQAGLNAFTLVPICPQSMTNRPIAVHDTSVIEILITKSGDARAHFDGQYHIDVQNFDRILIRRYHNPLRVLHPTDYQYFKTLRQKLHWGEQLI